MTHLISTDEFVRTNPSPVGTCAGLIVDHPNDQPPYVGLLLSVPLGLDPMRTVQYTFKLDERQAHELGVALEMCSLAVHRGPTC